MCTISIIALDNPNSGLPPGFRVVCNRDEHRERFQATPPRWHRLRDGSAAGRAIWPVDTHAGGTWIAAGEHGLVLAVLNHYPNPPVTVVKIPGLRSRGLMIPELVSEPTAEAVAARVRDNDLDKYAPFRLLAIEPVEPARGATARVAELRWNRTDLTVSWKSAEAMCFASSGLGDARAAPRLPLFREMVAEPGPTPERQDDFHRHTWPDRPEVSVMMSRTEAKTVSVTRVEVVPGAPTGRVRYSVDMAYEPIPETLQVMRCHRRDQRR